MFYVYVLCSIGRNYIYIGLTNDLKRRFSEHQLGENKTTKPYRPFRLLHFEEFHTRLEARKREKYLKSGIGKEWIRVFLLKSDV